MNTEVAVNKTQAVAAPIGAWGCEDASAKDLVVPRLQLVQATSDICKNGGARPGEIVNGQTSQILAPKGAFLDLLPILTVGSWVVSEPVVGAQPKFIRMEAVTPQNDSDNWKVESYENGKPVLKQKRLSVLVLSLASLDGFPFFIDFQKTNRKPGQILSTIIQENKFKNLPAPARVVSVSSALKTREQNSWFVYTVAVKRDATADELAACKRWYDIFASKAKDAVLQQEGGADEAVPF